MKPDCENIIFRSIFQVSVLAPHIDKREAINCLEMVGVILFSGRPLTDLD